MQATFYAQFGNEEVEFVTGVRHGNGLSSFLEFGPVPEEWKKVHAYLEEARRFHDPDDLDQADFTITKIKPNQFRFEAAFNNGRTHTGTLTVLADGNLKLVYPKED
jgi:hypothetical protein